MRRTAVLVLLLVTAVAGLAATTSAATFHQWCSRLTTEQLTDLGADYLKRRGQPDSALACFSIVAARYDGSHPPRGEVDRCVLSLFDAGFIFLNYYYDYRKAYSYMLRSLELAETNDSRYLPYIYLGLATLEVEWQAQNMGGVEAEAGLQKYRMAMRSAAGKHEWEAFTGAFNALAGFVLENDSPQHLVTDVAYYRSMHVPDSVPLARYSRWVCSAVDRILAGQTDQAMAYFDRAIANLEPDNLQATRLAFMARYYQARLQALAGHFDEAISMLTVQIDSLRSLGMWNALLLRQRALAEFYARSGQPQRARDAELSYLQQKDSFAIASQVGTMGEERFLIDLENSNERMKHLDRQRRVQRVVAVAAVSVALLLAVFLWLLGRKNRSLRIKNEKLFLKNEQLLRQSDEPKYQRSRLTADDKAQLVCRIDEVMRQTDVICSADFSLARLAELTQESKARVSQVINECYGKNFNQLLGDYRVREACRRLADADRYGGYTIEAIAESLGYRSRSNFAAVFRRQTGLKPSEYQRIARQKRRDGTR